MTCIQCKRLPSTTRLYFIINDGSLPGASNIEDSPPESEPSNNITYATVGAFSLIIVVSYVLVIKIKPKRP